MLAGHRRPPPTPTCVFPGREDPMAGWPPARQHGPMTTARVLSPFMMRVAARPGGDPQYASSASMQGTLSALRCPTSGVLGRANRARRLQTWTGALGPRHVHETVLLRYRASP